MGVVDAAVAMARSSKADVIISLGGRQLHRHGEGHCRGARQRLARHRIDRHVPLARGSHDVHIAIPTTAGDRWAAEVTNVAVIKNEHVGTKAYILDPLVAPDLAILDPTLIVGLRKLLYRL